MTKCNYCGTRILFGGKHDGDLRFCNNECHQKGRLLAVANQIPTHIVQQHINEMRMGNCPKCHGRGPNDVHISYKVWSAFLLTSWSSKPQICCRSCGMKSQLSGALFSLLFGWWGFPWGIIMTPIQIIRNIIGILHEPDPVRPSAQLENLLRINLAAHLGEQNQRRQHEA